jgi:hypothetical protein
MESQKEVSLADLREKMKQFEGISREKEKFLSSDLETGIPRGVLIELFGIGKTEWLIRFLSENAFIKAAWIEKKFTVHPTAIEQRGVSLKRILFVEAEHDFQWVVSQTIRSQLFEVVVIPGDSFKDVKKDRFLRRLQLLAEKANTSLFILSEEMTLAWCIAVQIKVSSSGIQIFKKKL